MSVYVVSWGIVNQGRNMETDSIVHRTLDEAREKEHPTNKLADWVYDASKTLIDEKVSQ